MKLPAAPGQYARGLFQPILSTIERGVNTCFTKGQDLQLQNGERLILKSPDGTLHQIKVDNSGNLSTGPV
jgi:hypothetical protein